VPCAPTRVPQHYHTLCDDFAADPRVALGHMVSGTGAEGRALWRTTRNARKRRAGARKDPHRQRLPPSVRRHSVQSAHVEDGEDGVAKVTFLYTYRAGACPKSYGLHVANLARLPSSVVQRAKVKSEEFEAAVRVRSRGPGRYGGRNRASPTVDLTRHDVR
jgi:hypothetical protein